MTYSPYTLYLQDEAMENLKDLSEQLQVSEFAVIQMALDGLLHLYNTGDESARWMTFQAAQEAQRTLQENIL